MTDLLHRLKFIYKSLRWSLASRIPWHRCVSDRSTKISSKTRATRIPCISWMVPSPMPAYGWIKQGEAKRDQKPKEIRSNNGPGATQHQRCAQHRRPERGGSFRRQHQYPIDPRSAPSIGETVFRGRDHLRHFATTQPITAQAWSANT